ncbi:hypothetical protein ACQ4N7_01185 [Nodosilinea sp. AN01ver1]|uniref:hypothetical protein n=1 Tax=Nodosilinea sp. AN01ver1 TaxID=3423362 RepID=UPI003D31A324
MAEILIPKGNISDMLATPYVHDPSLPEHIQNVLMDGMCLRAVALSEYLKGNLTYDDYLTALDQTGIDAIDFHEGLENHECCL